ncbi:MULTISPECIES: adenylosuccinate synthetase [unclassified Bradyrhizobium]|uniref:adenylosuccinate synthetase n=1 Tax=unclassified Bradyrhizobium TaxID=2631580 RepID=UPI001BA56813|nr:MULTISPECIES: adenylosuccinate synthetase [unclassified Bradyrhizobium]MBR1204936.1 adenylosuccinate synthetase [Bradyrhizobium sp. AUGA SZCCT0124]MBR1312022.1 adenylosuccinate synthetase [Bradyrhizobium sp. AUGA SZCCT0051]MBR1343752.1 adenylosuccinate synthetase [Bradyrhizobium sp. AUGA SZCCT0105]MBR1358293.1 adenylosuccinate synthetase [Bradyrhizobium sp. AUGA SZCCT0045]
MRQVVLISGHICTGKSELAQRLRVEFGYHSVSTSGILKSKATADSSPTDRLSLQLLGDELDKKTDHSWLLNEVAKEAEHLTSDHPIVVDNVRTCDQLQHFRTDHRFSVIHAHLWAPKRILEQRYKKKNAERPGETNHSYTNADLIKNEKDIEEFKNDADVRINTARTDSADTLVRVAARLGLYSGPDIRCVDVVVGGMYGSEGKGHIAAYLANDYDILVRVGGPNAGHTVSSSSGVYTYHQLPSGARDTNAKLLLGPGMTIYAAALLKEIAECKVTPDRLFIDPQAMIIEESDFSSEEELKKSIASTGRGSGAAAARRILLRGKRDAVRLARDVPELEPFVGDKPPYRGAIVTHLETAYREGQSILLEGTQGSGLSIFHGPYPYVTSRDTNVAGCLAEAGISPSRVRRILMVVRPTPIRVGNPDGGKETSGPLKHEVTFAEVATHAGLDPDEITKLEITSTTKRPRRVGWFEWDQFRNACVLNAPTDIVLTFADYLNVVNKDARRFEQLHIDTIKFIEELERVSQAPVSLINTRFPREEGQKIDLRSVIDRRTWRTNPRLPNE